MQPFWLRSNICSDLITCSLLHFAQHHGTDLFRGECLVLTPNLKLNIRLAMVVDHFVGNHLGIALHLLVLKTADAQLMKTGSCVGHCEYSNEDAPVV